MDEGESKEEPSNRVATLNAPVEVAFAPTLEAATMEPVITKPSMNEATLSYLMAIIKPPTAVNPEEVGN